MGSVCAETVGKDVAGRAKARLWVWLTPSEPHQIKYSRGESPNYNEAVELPLRVEAGALIFENGEDESDFLGRAVRSLLLPLMEAA